MYSLCFVVFLTQSERCRRRREKLKWNFTPLVSSSERLPCRAFLTSLIRHIISSGKYNNYSRCLLFSIYFIPAYFVESLQRIYSPVLWTMHYMKSFNTGRSSAAALWLQLFMGHRMNWWCYTHLSVYYYYHQPPTQQYHQHHHHHHKPFTGLRTKRPGDDRGGGRYKSVERWQVDRCMRWTRPCSAKSKRMRGWEYGQNGMENWITALKSFPSVFRMPRHPYHHHHRHPMLFHWG